MNNDNSNRDDELIVRAAKDYNEPSPVPREEIWNRIAEARRAATAASPVSTRPRRSPVWVWGTLGVAAAGLVAMGVAIGRGMERSRAPSPQAPSLQTARGDSNALPTAPGASAPGRSADTAPASVRSTPTPASTNSQRTAAADEQGNSAAIAYQLAVVQHIAGSEAMITAFRASARRGDVDVQLAKWSRDLLGETRMLESSAPPDDITMKRLLQDLELVLAQIVQYTNHDTHAPDDLDLIERSIKRRAVMSNLRTMSAGRLPSGT